MAKVRVAVWHQGINADSLRNIWGSSWRWREMKSRSPHMLRIERIGLGMRWGCTCQSYTPPGYTISCIPMTNGPAPICCPDCGARSAA